MDTGTNYLAERRSVNLIGVDKATAKGRLRDGLEGKNLTPGRIPGAMNIPPGFQLHGTLGGSRGTIQRVAWSLNEEQGLATPEQGGTVGLWRAGSGDRREFKDDDNLFVAYTCVACSPLSMQQELLAAGAMDGQVRLWNVRTGELQILPIPTANPGAMPPYLGSIRAVAWSPDGRMLAAALDKSILLWRWNTAMGLYRYLQELPGDHRGTVNDLAWSPDGSRLASVSNDQSMILWDSSSWQPSRHLTGHSGAINSVAWLFQQEIVASCSDDHTIRLWNFKTGRLAYDPLLGHSGAVTGISFSRNGHFLASKSYDDTVRLWHFDNWVQVAMLHEPSSRGLIASPAFHPSKPLLATLGKKDTVARIWQLDFDGLAHAVPAYTTGYYCSAKVVLVGDGGVGKTALWNALQGKLFKATLPTHGLEVERFDHRNATLTGDNDQTLTGDNHEMHEIFLWDLAGQTYNRLTHQLYLSDVAVALVVFDATREDPFAAIYYWISTLKQAQRVRERAGHPAIPLKIFVVAGRAELGGILTVNDRLKALEGQNFDKYFATSAALGWDIDKLDSAIRGAIDWKAFSEAINAHLQASEARTPLSLTRDIERFLADKKKRGQAFAKTYDLQQEFLAAYPAHRLADDAQFQRCLEWVAMQGLIRLYISGDLVLFRHELLGVYASDLVNTIKAEPGNEGHIAEKRIRKGDFAIQSRHPNRDEEKLLLIAMGEELLRQELAFRHEKGRWYLVFPSLCEHDYLAMDNPQGEMVHFAFKGSPEHIYATLIVRLKHSDRFHLNALSRNAATYTTRSRQGVIYGVILHDQGKGEGKLTLFFQKDNGEAQIKYDDACLYFEEFVERHLETRALPDSVTRRDIFACITPDCDQFGETLSQTAVERRLKNFDWMICQGTCNKRISLVRNRDLIKDQLEFFDVGAVEAMNERADTDIGLEVNAFVEAAKRDDEDEAPASEQEVYYSVYFCYLNKDEETALKIAADLEERGKALPHPINIKPFLRYNQIVGTFWLQDLEDEIAKSHASLVLVGKDSSEPIGDDSVQKTAQEMEKAVQEMEKAALLLKPSSAVIPGLLPGLPDGFTLQGFLASRKPVDFRLLSPNPLDELIQGILRRRFTSEERDV